jgi:hypothetical protein
MKQDARLKTYAEFWPFYLGEHSQAGTRALHFLGTLLGLGLLAAALVLWDWRLLASALVTGYGFAWLGHAFIERNRPATSSATSACWDAGSPGGFPASWRVTASPKGTGLRNTTSLSARLPTRPP